CRRADWRSAAIPGRRARRLPRRQRPLAAVGAPKRGASGARAVGGAGGAAVGGSAVGRTAVTAGAAVGAGAWCSGTAVGRTAVGGGATVGGALRPGEATTATVGAGGGALIGALVRGALVVAGLSGAPAVLVAPEGSTVPAAGLPVVATTTGGTGVGRAAGLGARNAERVRALPGALK